VRINNATENNSRLVLGTAQLGMPYGIANRTGQPDLSTGIAIVRAAWEGGIYEFDTAQSYGESEQILGRVLSEMGIAQKARIISKLHPTLQHSDKQALKQPLAQSLHRLKVSSLYGLMLHREELIDPLEDDLKHVLMSLVKKGRVKHVGVSVYSPEKALHALQLDLIDMVQLPTNVLDRRFQNAKIFELAEQKGKKIYIRSVFLQGLLLMNPEELPASMEFARPVLKTFEQLTQEFGMTRQQIALRYVKMRFPNAHVIFGAETPEQVKSNIASWAIDPPESLLTRVEQIFGNVDERVINPSLWPN